MILWMGLILVGYSDTNSGGGVEGGGGGWDTASRRRGAQFKPMTSY